MISRFASLTSRLSVALVFLFGIAACGGGGGGGSDGGGGFLPGSGGNDFTITLELLDADGNLTNTVTSTAPATLSVTVKNGDEIQAGVVVLASADIGLIIPPSGSALTNANGVATFRVEAGETLGAGTFTVTHTTVLGDEVIATSDFQVGLGTGGTIALELLDGNDELTNSVTSTTPATLRVTVKNGSGNLAGVIVVASTDIGLIVPASGTALTNANGVATFRIEAGDILGAGTLSVVHTPETGDQVVATLEFQVGQPGLRIGHYKDSIFLDGEIGVTTNTLPAGGTALLNLAVVDAEGIAVTDVVEISFSSDCSVNNLAVLPASVFAANGIANATYTAAGCSGNDTITASLVEGSNQAFGTVSIASPTAGSINFISAIPEIIALKGTGGAGRQENSEVIFQVVSGAGVPIPGSNVNFSLSTSIGGVTLNNTLALSDAEGLARTNVISGNVSTPVRVIATIEVDDGSGGTLVLTTISDTLVVSTGLPDQNSISLSAEELNVGGALDTDGLTTVVSVRLADKFNNPVPDGTAASFAAEYGSIGSSCITENGVCSVIWTSQAPRGFTDIGNVDVGRSTILVTVIGEEYFVDGNGNGTYDEDELFQNLPEAFLDRNEDLQYTPASNPSDLTGTEETFVDFNNNGIYDLNNSPAWYNGILCPQSGAGVFCSRDLLNVRSQITIVMSASQMNIELFFSGGAPAPDGVEEGFEYEARISDDFGNPPAGGAPINVTTSGDCSLLSASSFEAINTNVPGPYTFNIRVEGDAEEGATLSVAVTNGNVTSTTTFPCTTTLPVVVPPVDPNAPGGLVPGG
jgi:hypothetical protein